MIKGAQADGAVEGKYLRKIYPENKHYTTLYAGRKGFQDLMLNRGQRLEDISMWMGHQSIEMTWTKYRNRKRVSFTKTDEVVDRRKTLVAVNKDRRRVS